MVLSLSMEPPLLIENRDNIEILSSFFEAEEQQRWRCVIIKSSMSIPDLVGVLIRSMAKIKRVNSSGRKTGGSSTPGHELALFRRRGT